MVQFNLLPDIKIQYIKAKRQKHLVMLVSVVTIIASVSALAIMLAFVFFVQKKSISDLSANIKTSSNQLQSTPDLNKILTVQNQLKSLTQLHDAKPVATRIFGYITQYTPSAASISRLDADFGAHTMTITGSADTLETVNTFVDTLKFTTYHTASQPTNEQPAFSDVVLSSFGRDNKGATYTITLNFDPTIFSESEDISLTVPNKVTTRSQVAQPTALFTQAGTGQ